MSNIASVTESAATEIVVPLIPIPLPAVRVAQVKLPDPEVLSTWLALPTLDGNVKV